VRGSAVVLGVASPVLAATLWWGLPWRGESEHVVVAVGDMACAPRASTASASADGDGDGPALCRQDAVSDAMLARDPEALLALGDLQYEKGAPDGWGPYTRSYGRLRDITRPVPGNHEYLTADASGYYQFFGGRAGPAGRGYYAFTTGAWRIIALNSECTDVGGCGAGSPQLDWLQAELAEHNPRCTLAYWHIPRFSSGQHGDHNAYRTLWRTLIAAGVDLVLAGHDHNYERLAPMNADGKIDHSTGIRSFIVGTGGRNLRPVTSRRPGSEMVIDDRFGFLELRLGSSGYRWEFVGVDGKALDSGADECH
jgi:3',5'-cyclic AMP phosphodiesterase CpdA